MWSRQKMLGQDVARRWARRAKGAEVVPGGARVLVEESDGAEAFAYWRLLTDNGYDVQWCPGPGGQPGSRCALVACGHCELVERADVVVSSLGIDNEPSRDVLASIRRVYPETPVIVQASKRELSRWASLFDGNRILRTPVTGRALLDSVRDALAHRSPEPPVAAASFSSPAAESHSG